MSQITRFAARDAGPAARLAGFMAHLRDQGYRLGVAETELALAALTQIEAGDIAQTRLALRAVAAGTETEAARFDRVFDAYWRNAGRVRQAVQPKRQAKARGQHGTRDAVGQGDDAGRRHAPDTGSGEGGESSGRGKLQASRAGHLSRRDLRSLVDPQDIRAAEAIALRLGRALRDRRSRRLRAARKKARLDLRRTLRQSLATGGVPLRLAWRRRPDRPVKLVALCDVSGSMIRYARPYLAFLAGLMRADPACDAWIFHTRLTRITDALRDTDPIRALDRTTLLAEGIGGGSRIGAALAQFAEGPARGRVDGRTVVIVLSDGYDSDAPERIAAALARLKRRGCRIVWLNPLKGWAGYEPVAQGMAAALPHLDLFRAATTLDDLAGLETALARL